MGINQQQQSTSERDLLLQSDIKQKRFSNETINFGESGIEALKRSKRNPIPIPIITVAVRKLLQKWIRQYTLPVADTGWSWSGPNEEFKSLVTGLSDNLKSVRENFDKSFVDLDEPITCKNEQVFDATKKFRAILGFIQKIVDDPQAIQDISTQVAENYWAINRNYELLLDNHIASQALLLTNAGFLMGITSIPMMTNSQLDRSYESTGVVEDKVGGTTRRAESKVDRNLEVMLSGFKALECNFGNVIEKKFREVTNFVIHTKIEGITSELITVIRYFIHKKNAIRNLTQDQYITKLAGINDILYRLQNSRMPQSGSLHTLLYNIINHKSAIPENSNDKIAFTALGLLCFGTETYISIMSFLLEEYSYLADLHYQESDVEKYNRYFSSILTTFNDFKDSLVGNDGLIDAVVNILNEVKSYDFIKDEREDIVKFVSGKIDYLSSVKSQLIEISVLSQEKPARKIKYDFSNSQVNTPIGKWQDGRKVSYAVQFQDNDTYYPIGEWSTPYTVYGKANPLLDIGTDPRGRTRLIFRKFDNDKPELVGIVVDSNQREFRDISRDFYNAASEPNENMAINEMKILLENGADANARYERGRQAIHAVAESGNSNIMLTFKNMGTDVNARDINGYAPIHIAAEMGYEGFMQDLINNGADINAKTNSDWTALHIAAEKGHVSTIANLMQGEGIGINAKTKGGFTPLHIAASFGKNNVITSLSQNSRIDINAQSETGLTPLHLAVIGEYDDAVEALLVNYRIEANAKAKGGLTALHFASLTGNLAIVKFMIGHYRVNINQKSADGWTALHLAIESRKENVALELLSINIIEVSIRGKDDLTPLHLAASSGQGNIVSKLLDKGSSTEDVDKYNYTPLHFAIENGNLDVVKRLAEKGANLYAVQKDDYTPLSLAAYHGKLNIVQFLVNNKGVDVNTKNKNGMAPIDFAASRGYFDIVEFFTDKGAQGSALHWAAYGGHFNIVKYLVDEKHFDFKKTDKYGNIPVHIAALQGHFSIVKYFIDQKQVDLNTESNGYTPFLFAVLGGNLNIIKYFVDDKNVKLTHKDDNNGNTVLHLAALNSNLGVIKYLIKKGANVSAIDNYGNTSLFLAASRGHLDMVQYLIQKGADLRATNNYGNSLLYFASWGNHFNVARYLIEKGVYFNVTNENGDTPLHLAAFSGNLNLVKYLIDKGASLTATSKDGYTPLHVAAASGNLDIVKYLLEQGINIHTRIIKSNKESNNGKTALHVAAQDGRLDVVEYLIKENADISSRDDNAKTPRDLATDTDVAKFLEEAQLNLNLLNAIKQGNFDKVEKYSNQGASFKVKDKNGNTLQEIATRNGNTKVIEFLKQKELDFNLINAVKQGNPSMVKKYILRGANFEVQDKDGHSLLYLAAQNYDIEQLLNQARFNLNLINAVKRGDLDKTKCASVDSSLEIKDKNGNTLLHLAAFGGHLDIVKYLIEKGADLHATNKNNGTPLHAAASNGKLNVVEYLIEEKKVNLEVQDKDGNTSLSLAARGGHLDVVEYLVEKGANLSVTNKSGNTPMYEAMSFDIVKYFAEKGANINAVNKNGFTLLHVAAANGNLDVVKYLIEEKGTNIDAKDKNGNSPLDLATQNGYLDTVKYLAGKGADISTLNNLLNSIKAVVDERIVSSSMRNDSDMKLKRSIVCEQDRNSHAKFSYFFKSRKLHIRNNATEESAIIPDDFLSLKVVEDNSDNSKKLAFSDMLGSLFFEHKRHNSSDNFSSECSVIYTHSIETQKCFDLNDYPSQHQPTFQLSQGSESSVDIYTTASQKIGTLVNEINFHKRDDFCYTSYYKELVGHEHYSYKVTKNVHLTINTNGNTSLHAAALSGYLSTVKYFVNKGVNLNVVNKDRWSPLHIAAQAGHLDIVKYLVEKGADLSATDGRDANPLHLAAASGRLDVVQYLVEKGANVHTRMIENNGGDTVLHLAAKSGNLNVVKYLIEAGAYLNDTNKYAYTPLYVANSLDIVKYLVEEKKANINTTASDGSTPLHQAAYDGRLDIVRYFIEEKGANLHVTTNDGSTPLHQAAYSGKLDIMRYLIEEKGYSLNVKDNSGKTLIHIAAQEGHLDIVKYLVEQGADLNATDKFHYTPLHTAAAAGQLDMVKYFIEEKRVDLNVKDNSGKIPLYFAVQEGNLDVVKYLVKKGANVHAKDNYDYTPLHIAARAGKLDVVKYLIAIGADVNARNNDCNNALHFAAQHGTLDVVKYLMEKGADIQAANKYSYTPLDSATSTQVKNFLRQLQLDISLVNAVKQGNLTLVKKYVSKGASLDAQDKNGNTLLNLAVQNTEIVLFLRQAYKLNLGIITAAKQGNLGLIKEYISKGANLNTKDNDGNTPLHLAAYWDKLNVVKYLIDEKGVDYTLRDNYGRTPLHLAIRNGNLDTVKYLIDTKGADFNLKADDGWSSVHFAVYSDKLDVVKYFVDEKEADLNLEDNYGRTPFHLAAENGNLDIVKYLVDTKGADFNFKTNGGWTPLHLAANNGHLNTVKYLIDDKGANFTLRAHDGWTPLHLAASNGYLDTVKYLIDTKGADFTVKAYDGWTPLHSAAFYGKLDVVKYLVDTKGADFTLKTNDDRTPLHLAVFSGSLDVVKYLIDTKGADFTLKVNDGSTPLHLAAFSGKLDVVKYLIDTKKADFTLKANDGSTPLHLAASSGKLSVVKYLIEKGADIYVKDEYGRTPLSLIGSKRVELIHYLESKDTHRFRRSEKRSKSQVKGVATPICHGAGRHVTSGAGRVTAWIPQWITQKIYNFISAKPAIDVTAGHEGAKERIQGNVWQFSTGACMQNNVSVGLLLLQNFFDRNCPLPKFQDVTFGDAQSYALNITDKFEECIRDKYGIRTIESINLFEMQSQIQGALISGSGSKIPGIILSYATSIVGPKKAEVITFQVLESAASAVNQTSELPTYLHDVTVKNLPHINLRKNDIYKE